MQIKIQDGGDYIQVDNDDLNNDNFVDLTVFVEKADGKSDQYLTSTVVLDELFHAVKSFVDLKKSRLLEESIMKNEH